MVQARLPDINTSFIVYRREAINSWKVGNYDSAIGSLYAYNALLYPDYGVKVSTQAYNEKTDLATVAECNFCTEQTDYKTLDIINLLNPLVIGLVSNSEYEKIWCCPKCHKDNKLLETKIVHKVPQEPNFLRIVPKPPERKEGMTKYHNKFSVWFWSTLDELEAEAARFRQEYKPIDQNIDYDDIDTTIEESS